MTDETYFDRYAYPKVWLTTPPKENTGLIVTIPAYNESSLIPTFESLKNCDLPDCKVEIIAVVNESKNDISDIKRTNLYCFHEATEWVSKNGSDDIIYHIIYAKDLSEKNHGVGLARKIGMDEALRRFKSINNINRGIIACFDADSTCDTNYFKTLVNHFHNFPECPGVSIYFEHPLDDLHEQILRNGIIEYELHLRYYIHAQRYSGFPHAFHAVGSSMAVKSDIYQKQGGMNKRKAGEDFYFLHKIISLGGFQELNSTKVYPAVRVSERVPFGTGKALYDWVKNNSEKYFTYNPRSFVELRNLFSSLPSLYDKKPEIDEFGPGLKSFLQKESFLEELADVKINTSNYSTFRKRFFQWFNAFK